ncbi:MAG: DNA methyltransferase [Candidatus Cybelea sp.]
MAASLPSHPQIRVVPLVALRPAPYNPRRIDRAAMAGLTKSMERFGDVQPIVWNQRSGYIVGGHQRLKVLKRTKVQEAAVVVVDLDETEEKALNVALNSRHLAGEFTDALQALLAEIQADDAALFSDLRFDALLAEAQEPVGLVDPDLVPQRPKTPVTQSRDLWELGRHRLLCGDCRDAPSLTRLFGGARVTLALTSPPYAQQRTYDQASGFQPIPPDQYVDWFADVAAGVRAHLADDGSFCLNIKEHAEAGQRSLYVKDLTIAFVRQWGWRLVDEFVWTHGGTPRDPKNSTRLKNGFEPIFHFALGECKWRPDQVRHLCDLADIPAWGGAHPSQSDGMAMKRSPRRSRMPTSAAQGRSYKETGNDQRLGPESGLAYPSNVLSLGKNREALGHGAVFPVGLPSFFIRLLTDRNDCVFDPFCGAGTTLIGCEQLQRVGYGCEISPAHCDVIVERWQNFTGKKARRAAP